MAEGLDEGIAQCHGCRSAVADAIFAAALAPSGSDRGMMRRTSAPISINAVCQPKAAMKAWPSGRENELAERAGGRGDAEGPGALFRRHEPAESGHDDREGRDRDAHASHEAAGQIHEPWRIREGHQGNASGIDQRADDQDRGVPYLSAKPPAIGWKIPQAGFGSPWRSRRFHDAIDGNRRSDTVKRPMVARAPKETTATRQPATMITVGS